MFRDRLEFGLSSEEDEGRGHSGDSFQNSYEYVERLVRPLGDTNAPFVFMDEMNRVSDQFLDGFVVVFIEDIHIYSKNREKHEVHLRPAL